MKKLLPLLALVGAACQPQAVPTIARAAVTPNTPTPQVAAPTLTLLRERDMANLLQGRGYIDSENELEVWKY